MVFSSVLFLFLFLPVVLLLYWVIPNKWRNSFLLIVSLTFYAWGEGLFVGIMLLSIAMNYVFGLAIERGNARAGRLWVGIAVMANLALLGVFKYANFLVENINTLFSSTGIQLITIDQIHLPIGISFFTFQAMSYVIEVHRRVMPAQTNLLNLGLYIALFPQLIAGPIVRYHDIAAQLKTRFVNAGQVAYGIERFVIGLGKKVLIANPMGAVADEIFALPPDSITATVAWTAVACYSLQIYFDFSGYSDMAIGLGRMFGFKFLENFNYPYISQSIQEFWRRWHISLSNWFRDFLYLPLGGNRRGPGRTYFNLLIVFLLCGLWHGASWNFVVWGLLHGSFLVLERIGFLGVLNRVWRPLRHCYVIFIVMIAWVFFRVETLSGASDFLETMLLADTSGKYQLDIFFDYERAFIFVVGIIIATPVLPWIRSRYTGSGSLDCGEPVLIRHFSVHAVKHLWLLTILVFSSMHLMAGSHNPFIYFRF